MEDLLTWSALVSLLTLTVMEVVLGIDNIIFISIVAGKLPNNEQKRARAIGLSLALIIRVLLLFTIKWIIGQNEALFRILGYGFSARDLILLGGGLFLLTKSTREIHEKLEGQETDTVVRHLSLTGAIIQIVFLDVIFSFDSILTAVGVVEQIEIMIAAVVISLGIMLAASGKISEFVNKHPTIKMLALSFLLMIGFLLVADGLPDELGLHIPKGYLYFAMAFSLFVELLNMRARRKQGPVRLRNPRLKELKDDVYDPNGEEF